MSDEHKLAELTVAELLDLASKFSAPGYGDAFVPFVPYRPDTAMRRWAYQGALLALTASGDWTVPVFSHGELDEVLRIGYSTESNKILSRMASEGLLSLATEPDNRYQKFRVADRARLQKAYQQAPYLPQPCPWRA